MNPGAGEARSVATSTPAFEPAAGPLVLCRECDWVMHRPALAAGESAHCPRCGHHVAGPAAADSARPLAWALATLILLGLVFAFDFLSFSTRGVGHTMTFMDSARALVNDDFMLLGAVLLATTVLLPGIYLVALVGLFWAARQRVVPHTAVVAARRLRPLEPWMMSDVFVVGVLVSLIKIVTLADIQLGASFIAFCAYSLALLRTLTLVDWTTLWTRLAPPLPADPDIVAGRTGKAQGLVACRGCDSLFKRNPGHRCPRCGRRHPGIDGDRIEWTWALLAAAALLYVPANVYPILSTTSFGHAEGQTIVGGVYHLIQSGSWPIAAVIFIASVVVPVGKIVALSWLCVVATRPAATASRARMRLYRLTEKIGRWSMIDVFVVAVLGALVQAGALMSITPGPAVLPFAAVVVLTMLAALAFDSRRLWDEPSAAAPTP